MMKKARFRVKSVAAYLTPRVRLPSMQSELVELFNQPFFYRSVERGEWYQLMDNGSIPTSG